MAYTIQINEYQRGILATALGGLTSNLTEEDLEELRVIHQMLVGLPADEAETPGALHGFCI